MFMFGIPSLVVAGWLIRARAGSSTAERLLDWGEGWALNTRGSEVSPAWKDTPICKHASKEAAHA
jgi:hypothetical protein